MTKTVSKKSGAAQPVMDAFKSAQPKMEVPEAARDLAKRAAETVLERAESINAGAEQATAAIERAATDTVANVARMTRDIQAAVYDDAKAAIAAFENVVAAKSLGEAAQIQIDYLRARSDVTVARVKTIADFLTKAAEDAVKTAQDNFARLTSKVDKAA